MSGCACPELFPDDTVYYSMDFLRVDSPAKINLYLRVVGKMDGGYHRLVTVFHRISLRDTLILKKSKSQFSLRTNVKGLSVGEDNLITKAYRLLQKDFPEVGKVQVSLIKRVPIQGGLGGGSSNAAFFLLAMKKLYRLPLSLADLRRIGARLGADIPFFMHDTPQAIGTGRGDVIHTLSLKRPLYFLILLFDKGLSTKEVYGNVKLSPRGASLTNEYRVARIASRFFGRQEEFDPARGLHNDLEEPAVRMMPEIMEAQALMIQLGAPAVAMSGSGPTTFAVFSSQKGVIRFARQLEKYFPSERIRICSTY